MVAIENVLRQGEKMAEVIFVAAHDDKMSPEMSREEKTCYINGLDQSNGSHIFQVERDPKENVDVCPGPKLLKKADFQVSDATPCCVFTCVFACDP